MRKVLSILVMMLLSVACFADIITFKSSKVTNGEVTGYNDGMLEYRTFKGKNTKCNISEVKSITMSSKNTDTVDPEPDTVAPNSTVKYLSLKKFPSIKTYDKNKIKYNKRFNDKYISVKGAKLFRFPYGQYTTYKKNSFFAVKNVNENSVFFM